MRPFIFLLGQVTHYKETLFFVFVKKKKIPRLILHRAGRLEQLDHS